MRKARSRRCLCFTFTANGKRRSQWKLTLLLNSTICVFSSHLDVSQHQLRGQMSKTPKEMYAASSNAASSCGLCKSVGDSANCKNLFRKANRTLVVAAEEI